MIPVACIPCLEHECAPSVGTRSMLHAIHPHTHLISTRTFQSVFRPLKVLQRTLPKPDRLRCGNWEAPRLSTDQQRYAALDAYASLAVYSRLQVRGCGCCAVPCCAYGGWYLVLLAHVHLQQSSFAAVFICGSRHLRQSSCATRRTMQHALPPPVRVLSPWELLRKAVGCATYCTLPCVHPRADAASAVAGAAGAAGAAGSGGGSGKRGQQLVHNVIISYYYYLLERCSDRLRICDKMATTVVMQQ